MYDFLYRNLFTFFDAEYSHRMALQCLRVVGTVPPVRAGLARLTSCNLAGMSINALGLAFDHPLGLAAGFDKDALCLAGLRALGFSFVEVGTVTPRPQHGNDGKRMIRLLGENALVNRMGFPSLGASVVEQRLRAQPRCKGPIGISLGNNRETPLDQVVTDYQATLDRLYPYGDYFVINISSPNTANLRKLQTADYLGDVMSNIRQHMNTLAGGQPIKPLLIKIAADLTWEQIDNLIALCLAHQLDGVIATNTLAVSRDQPADQPHSPQKTFQGGLSGEPLRERSTEIIRYIYQRTQGKLSIIGVGGVFTGDDLWNKLEAGASLVQSYTGFIYRGPMFVKKVLLEVRQRMEREGVHNLHEIIGAGHQMGTH
jgi:dihydroorotate dehydrogenase